MSVRRLSVVAAGLVDPDGRLLVGLRPRGREAPGVWEFPGGKIGPEETPEQALCRELHEELDIDVTAACLAPLTFVSAPDAHGHLLLLFYLCRGWRGCPRPLVHEALRWVRTGEMRRLEMPGANAPLVAALRELF